LDTQLSIRPGLNDHRVVESLLAPGGSGIFKSRRPVIGQLVADATVAAARPALADAAAAAGIPYLVDPLTPLLQGELAPNDRWARLPFGQEEAVTPTDLQDSNARRDLIARVVTFQMDLCATAIIPPYTYALSPSDPWFQLNLQLIRETADYMIRSRVRLRVVPILAGQLQHFGQPGRWAEGLGLFSRVASSTDPLFIGLCMSPAGAADESYGKVHRLFALALRLRAQGMRTVAWRQGIYGPGLVAAGLDGYETGIGVRERTDIAASVSRRKPRPPTRNDKPRTPQGLFVLPFGRSLSLPLARQLLEDVRLRANIVCDDEQCCPDGIKSMVENYREHSVRSRARYLAELDDMPMPDWRLFKIGKDARESVGIIEQANRLLARTPERTSLRTESMSSLARVADHMLEERMPRGA